VVSRMFVNIEFRINGHGTGSRRLDIPKNRPPAWQRRNQPKRVMSTPKIQEGVSKRSWLRDIACSIIIGAGLWRGRWYEIQYLQELEICVAADTTAFELGPS
jgi:hypothetical protein